MTTHIVEINFTNLMDALLFADDKGTRIRAADMGRVMSFLAGEDYDFYMLQSYAQENLNQPKMCFIDDGMMRGAYAYSMIERRAFTAVESDSEPRPLVDYWVPQGDEQTDDLVYDIAISYSSEDRDAHALRLRDELIAQDLRVYVLDVAEDPKDPLWKIRFREAMFHSHYTLPILGMHYAEREGTQLELKEVTAIIQMHQRTEYFYPLIPLLDPSRKAAPPSHATSDIVDGTFVWTHTFGLSLGLATDKLAAFFASLVRNNNNQRDWTYLETLADQIRYIDYVDFGGRKAAMIYLQHPTLSYFLFMIPADGVARYIGVHEPNGTARTVDSADEALAGIYEHFEIRRT